MAIQFFHSIKIVCSADLDIQYFVVGRSPITSNFIVEMDQNSTWVISGDPGDLCKW